jgi:outer membrane protein assembly factor BamD
MKKLLAILLASLLVGGCATTGDEVEDKATAEANAQAMYEKAKKQLDKRNYELAIEQLEKLEAAYPFGEYAQKAQLDIAYAHYKMNEPDAAIAAADQFVRLNPLHENVDYAYYIKGLANATRYDSFFDRFVSKDLGDLDPNPLKQAFLDFKLLVRRFPDSKYAEDARQRMVYLRNALARHEYNIADFYWRRGAFVAVVNRCSNVIKEYDGAEIMPETIALMARAYKKLDLQEEYDDAVKLFEANFPDRKPLLRQGSGLFSTL